MHRPALGTRIEQTHQLSCARVKRRNIGTLELVAPVTGQGEIRQLITTAMLPGNNVFDLVFQEWNIALMM